MTLTLIGNTPQLHIDAITVYTMLPSVNTRYFVQPQAKRSDLPWNLPRGRDGAVSDPPSMGSYTGAEDGRTKLGRGRATLPAEEVSACWHTSTRGRRGDRVTRYGLDEARQAVVAMWGTGAGDVAATVTKLPAGIPVESAFAVVDALSALSSAAWWCYTHPASAARGTEPNSEGWRRQVSREAFAEVASAVKSPNLPVDETIVVSYIPVVEAAHRLGRALHGIQHCGLTNAIAAEVQAELDAIEQAERGDLTGRARQAVMLSREDASPLQVAAADELLSTDPLGSSRLFTEVDPTAASVAAAHWLAAAAEVTAEVSGIPMTSVVEEADNIEALPYITPTLVLEQIAAGVLPHDVVTSLIRDAMTAAEGGIPDLDSLFAQIEGAERLADTYSEDSLWEELPDSIRTTPLDPTRPAHDLLEDLLAGIRGCMLLYDEYVDAPEPDSDATTTAFLDAIREQARTYHRPF